MFELIPTYLSVVIAFMLGYLIIKMYNFERSLPDFTQIFDELGGNISEIFEKGFKQPSVSKAMSIIGKESGKVRASTALVNRVADKAMGENILLKKAYEYFDITPVEGLQLLQDPTVGPMIRGFMAKTQQGLGGVMGGGGNGGSPSSNFKGYGREE